MNIKLPIDVETILEQLEYYGYEAYVVGGCVRDTIMGLIPHDWDICTSATPQQIKEVFEKYIVIETGLKHGTVTLMMTQTPYEITTYRIDGNYSDNRRPDNVEYTTNLIEDLNRRDFTINSMAYNPRIGLIDPFNGQLDIINKEIRCVGNPLDRFNEDALRILRAWRFECQFGFSIELDTLKAMYCCLSLLDNISVERIREEFIKSLSNISGFVISVKQHGNFLNYIIPEFKRLRFNQQNQYHIYPVDIHTWNALLNYKENDLITKMALLFHDIGKPQCYSEDENRIGHFYKHAIVGAEITDNILKRLKFDNKTREDVVELVSYHDAEIVASNKHIKRWLNKIGEMQFRRLLDMKEADIKAQNLEYINRVDEIFKTRELLDNILDEKQCFTMKDLVINGEDLMNIGYKQGKVLGSALKGLLECVIVDEVENSREELLNLAKKWIE